MNGVDLVRTCSLSRAAYRDIRDNYGVHHGTDTESPRNKCRLRAVLTADSDRIAAVTGFVTFGQVDLPGRRQVTAVEVFARFGLPARLP